MAQLTQDSSTTTSADFNFGVFGSSVEEPTKPPEVIKVWRLDGVAMSASLGTSLVCSACMVLVLWRVCCAGKSGTARRKNTERPLTSLFPPGDSVNAQVQPAPVPESPESQKQEEGNVQDDAPEPQGNVQDNAPEPVVVGMQGGEAHQHLAANPMEDARIEELNLAIEAQDIERLEIALSGARRVDTRTFNRLLERLLERGEQLLAELRRKADLEASLRQAAERKNKAELEKLLPVARLVHGFSPELLDVGERALRDVQAEAASNVRQGVEMALRAAIIEGDLESLEQLMAEAKESGVSKDVLQGASEHIEKLQAKRDMERAMREAMDAGDLDRLIDLLGRSLEVAVSLDVIEQAEAVIQTLQRMREIEADLRAALKDQDSERIHAQLKAARQAKLSQALIHEAEEELEKILDIQLQVRSAIKARNLSALQRTLISVRANRAWASLLQEARQAEVTLLEQVLEEELRSAIDNGSDLVLLCELVIRAENMQFLREQSTVFREASELLSKRFKLRSVEVSWDASSGARPWQAKGIDWERNPVVQVRVCEGEPQGVHKVHAFLEDLDSHNDDASSGDDKYGFAVTSNPSSMSYCTTLVPGGPVLAEAEIGDNFIAKSAFDLRSSDLKQFLESGTEVAGTAYAVASLRSDVQRGGRAKFHFLSEVELRVEAVPSLGGRWETSVTLDAEWQPSEEEPCGPLDNAATWLSSNPSFEVSVNQIESAVLVVVLLPPPECKAKLHMLTLKDGHMHLKAGSFDVIAHSENSHSEGRTEIMLCAELDEDGPFFLVPSLDSAPSEAKSFQLQLRSNSQMEVEKVTSNRLIGREIVLE